MAHDLREEPQYSLKSCPKSKVLLPNQPRGRLVQSKVAVLEATRLSKVAPVVQLTSTEEQRTVARRRASFLCRAQVCTVEHGAATRSSGILTFQE